MSDIFGIDALRQAIEHLGTQAAAATAIGIKQQTVSEVVREGKRVPAEWCIPLDLATAEKGSRVSCHQLRPDLWPEDFQPESQAAA